MQKGKIEKIKIFHKKGEPPQIVSEAECAVDLGLLGDRFAKGGEKQLTAIDDICENWLCTQQIQGLCFARYKANITVKNMDLSALKQGQKLVCGGAELLLSESCKECFDECVLVQGKLPCMLRRHARYLKVAKGGIIAVNDEILTEE